MKIIKNKVEELIVKSGYTYKEEYSDKQINTLLNLKRPKMFVKEEKYDDIKLIAKNEQDAVNSDSIQHR